MKKLIAWFRLQANRGKVYRAVGVIGVVALGAGWVTSGQEQTILTDVGLVLGVSGNGLASIHTPTKRVTARRQARAAAKRKG